MQQGSRPDVANALLSDTRCIIGRYASSKGLVLSLTALCLLTDMNKPVDYLRVYPGLNDMGDALEAIPIEMVRHLTLLKEIDAKCTSVAPQLSGEIDEFMRCEPSGAVREEKLKSIVQMLKEMMPCIEEKMHVANMAADIMRRHVERVETDYQLIIDHEIPKETQFDENDPALSEIRPLDKQQPTGGTTRSEAVREAAAARKAAAQAALENSRARTPVTRGPGRGRRPAHPVPTPDAAFISTVPPPMLAPEPTQSPEKRKRMDDGEHEAPPRRRRGTPNPAEPVYCYCEQSGFGDMVGCDGPDCRREWFHLECIGLSAAPKGQWFCEECSAKYRRAR